MGKKIYLLIKDIHKQLSIIIDKIEKGQQLSLKEEDFLKIFITEYEKLD